MYPSCFKGDEFKDGDLHCRMTATKKNTVKVVNLFGCVTTSLPFLQLVDHCDLSLVEGLMDVTVILYSSYLVLTFNVFWCSSWTVSNALKVRVKGYDQKP